MSFNIKDGRAGGTEGMTNKSSKLLLKSKLQFTDAEELIVSVQKTPENTPSNLR